MKNKEEIKRKLITHHLENWKGIEKASIESYAETGKISGSLFISVKEMMDAYVKLWLEEKMPSDDDVKKYIKENEADVPTIFSKAIDTGVEVGVNWIKEKLKLL